MPTLGNPTYTALPWPVTGLSSLMFGVSISGSLACPQGSVCVFYVLLSNSSVALDPTARTYQLTLTVFPGAATAVVIRHSTSLAVAGGRLPPNGTVFRLCWANNGLSVGAGPVSGRNLPKITLPDPSPTPINYVLFAAGHTTATFYVAIPGPHPLELCGYRGRGSASSLEFCRLNLLWGGVG